MIAFWKIASLGKYESSIKLTVQIAGNFLDISISKFNN